jgi:transcriptional regulator with XRE-family HTH domain
VAARKQDVEKGGKKEGTTARTSRSGSKDELETEPRPSRERPLAGPGDDVGAAELGRRVADHLRERRKARGMSLDDLARSSGVSRAALSQVETCKSNPTVGLLWKIAVGLGVPFSELIGERRTGATVLRRGDAQVLRSLDGKLESRPLREPPPLSGRVVAAGRALRASPRRPLDSRFRGARARHSRAPRRPHRLRPPSGRR